MNMPSGDDARWPLFWQRVKELSRTLSPLEAQVVAFGEIFVHELLIEPRPTVTAEYVVDGTNRN